jgi:signal transduction histidine kinase
MHHGGLCERTITRQNYPHELAVYEECDMTKNERTKDLPFVKGDVAKFRYYAGVPLNPYGGPNIGTVFFFSEKPCENGLSADNRSYLCETALHITKHLERAVEALEGKRVLRFNHGVASLLRVGSSEEIESETGNFSSETEEGQGPLISNQYTTAALRLYRMAASILCDTFEFDAVRIQEVGSSRNYINHNPDWNGSKLLAQHLGPNAEKFEDPSEALMRRLLDLFPRGGVFQIIGESGKVIAATNATNAAAIVDRIVSTELPKTFPGVKQMILMPLWDTYHERNIGAVLGFAYDQSRVYLGSTDLPSMSALCTTIMTQARRLETQAMDKIKSDFLGSVSHEMRTPLHGILSSLELLADTPYNTHQHDLLETARYSGVSLLNTIDRVLSFSKISSKAYFPEDTLPPTSNGRLPPVPSPPIHQRATSSSEPAAPGVIHVCEGIIRREAQKLRLKETVRPELFGRRQRTSSWQLQATPLAQSWSSAHHPIIVFDTNVAWSCRLAASAGFETVFTNLLVSYGLNRCALLSI